MTTDLPKTYEPPADAFQFIRAVPVDWADTKLLDDYVLTARNAKGSDNWFPGAITDENSHNLFLNPDFLTPGALYEATIYDDAPTADR